MLFIREQTCFFAGPRTLPEAQIDRVLIRLDHEVEQLIAEGITTFVSGGEPGFDLMAAALIIAKKQMGRPIRLIFALPYPNRDRLWSIRQKTLHSHLKAEADEVLYVSDEYIEGCMQKHRQHMAQAAAYCICALGETQKAVKAARRQGIKIIDVAE